MGAQVDLEVRKRGFEENRLGTTALKIKDY